MSLYAEIEKRLGDFHLSVSLRAEDEVLALLGASGCGKSMTLKCIAGIEKPDRGRIVVDDVVLFDSEKRIDLSPQQRWTGLMFQSYALFPNMTVLQNIRAGARREKDKAGRERQVREIMELFGLTELAGHLPSQLSGGQQQRTALARILVSGPNILLLDEPFSALDSHLRFQLEQEVRQVIRRFGKTVLLVSHDRDEVFRLSDKIAVMDRGRVEVFGTKSEVFSNPRTPAAARLTGCKNLSACEALADGRVFAKDWGMTLEPEAGALPGTQIGIQMQDVAPGPGENQQLCRVAEVIENPFSVTVMLRPVEAPGAAALGMELDKALWAQYNEAEQVLIHLPKACLLSLKEAD